MSIGIERQAVSIREVTTQRKPMTGELVLTTFEHHKLQVMKNESALVTGSRALQLAQRFPGDYKGRLYISDDIPPFAVSPKIKK